MPTDIVDDEVDFGLAAAGTSEALRALSHEHRLMILNLLSGTERCVGDLEMILKIPQPAVSQQLARLRLDDMVVSRRMGRTIYYTTNSDRVRSIFFNLGAILKIEGFVPEPSPVPLMDGIHIDEHATAETVPA